MASNCIINGVTYPSVPEIQIPRQGGGTARFYDSGDATAQAGDFLAGKTGYTVNGLTTGTMPDNGDTSGIISTKTGTVTIPAGYTSGGSVQIAAAQQDQIVTGNIRAGVTILGVSGKSSVVDTTIPSDAATAATIVEGKKAWVNGALLTGSASMPTITQDSTTRILSIS